MDLRAQTPLLLMMLLLFLNVSLNLTSSAWKCATSAGPMRLDAELQR